MHDKLEMIGSSLIQHGKYNDRIYLLDFNPLDLAKLFNRFNELVKKNNYAKIVAKVPENYKNNFINKGYIEEAKIPNYYNGEVDLFFLAKYHELERKKEKEKNKAKQIIQIAKHKRNENSFIIDKTLAYKILDEKDIGNMIELYKRVFKTYPFPIFESDYLKQTMNENIIYFGVFKAGVLIGISACEINYDESVVEMTDFAVLKNYRGKQISLFLLHKMEAYMRKLQIKKAYTMARSLSYGMNIAFSKMGYNYSGTVINNANISGAIESLNIWHKDL